MNTIKIMKNGHKSVLAVVKGLDGSLWQTLGACGEWSVKDILAHLASYEWMLVEALDDLIHEGAATPTLKRFGEGPAAFNDVEVGKRRDHSVDQVLNEYKEAHGEARTESYPGTARPTTWTTLSFTRFTGTSGNTALRSRLFATGMRSKP